MSTDIFGGGGALGGSTEAKQDTAIARLTSILSEVTGAAKDTSVQAVTAAVEAIGDGATVAQVVARLDTDAATQAAILAELEAQGVDLETVVTTLATIASDTDLLVPDADATRVAVESIDDKTLTPLGTAFLAPVRGAATAVAAQLPSSSTPRGFTLENIDPIADLWVGTSSAVTTANGFRISPSRSRFFDLPNPNGLWVISASTTAWQIGAVT